MLELKNINIKYGNKECIRQGHFYACSGHITGIYGESGTGKSSLLYMIAMLSSHKCEYYFSNQLLNLDEKEKDCFRNRHISFVTQNSTLIDTIDVENNIKFYLLQSGFNQSVDELLELIGLKHKKKVLPISLSGGERQRVAIACAIAKNSSIILADEPTSSLDDENKNIIMNLLRECADLGKIVILVSHEIDILNRCDRVYQLDHLELIDESNKHIYQISVYNVDDKIINSIRLFQILFHSCKKNNIQRIVFSLIVVLILFLSVSLGINSYNVSKEIGLSLENVSNTKLTVFSNVDGKYEKSKDYIKGVAYPNDEQLSLKDISLIESIEHIESIYDYVIFQNGISKNGTSTSMELKVFREGKEVEKKTSVDSPYYYIDGDTGLPEYDYFVCPYYEEEKLLEQKGVYVNTHLAYLYNIEVGDMLEMKLSVPFAMMQSLQETISPYNGVSYCSQGCIYEEVQLSMEVIGIVDTNAKYDNVVLMKYEDMKELMEEQIDRYHNGSLVINEDAFIEYNTILDYKTYAKTVFVDKYTNVLEVQNAINTQATSAYAYNEYYLVNKVMEQYQNDADKTLIISIIAITLFALGSLVVEILFISRYKSTYMTLKLTGVDIEAKWTLFTLHGLWQAMIMLSIGIIIYFGAMIPEILVLFNITSYDEVMMFVNDFYSVYRTYCSFSFFHFSVLICSVFVVVFSSHFIVCYAFEKKAIISWIRGK